MLITTSMGKRLGTLLLAAAMSLLLVLPALAATPTAFSIRAEIPDNQIDRGHTYFDLQVTPGQVQLVQVAVTNAESRDILADITLNPASTAQNGLIIYSDPDARDESMQLAITDFAEVVEPTVRLAPGETRMVGIRLELPEEPFAGTVLGGVGVTARFAEETGEDDAPAGGFQIENRYAYVIGLKLRQDLELVEPDFHLRGIEPGLVNYRQALVIDLQQSEPVIAGDLTVSAAVTREDDSAFSKTLALTGAQMAPSSGGDFVVDWDAPIEPGIYRLRMRVDWRERFWEWDEEFVIAGAQAQSFNEESVMRYDAGGGTPIWIFIVIGLLLVLILLLLFLLLRRRRREEPAQPQ